MAVGSLIKQVGIGGLVGDGMNVWGFASDYKSAREQGDSKAVSLAKGAGSFAWGEMVFGGAARAIEGVGLTGGAALAANIGFAAAYMGVTAGTKVTAAMWQHNAKTMADGYSTRGKFGSGHFDMTEAGYTMRQRSLNAIRSNGLNTQSVLGNEARTYFRGA